jgi:hypothetical protein
MSFTGATGSIPSSAPFYGGWNSDGRIALIEAWQHGTNWLPVHNRTWLARTAPELAAQFPTHRAFGAATVQQILGPRYGESKALKATELQVRRFSQPWRSFRLGPLPARGATRTGLLD